MASRIGMLRNGRVVAVDQLETLRAKSLHHVEAQFDGPVSVASFAAVDGVRDVRVDDGVLRCDAPRGRSTPW